MSSSIGNIGTNPSFAISGKKPSEEEILAKIEKDFGKSAVASVTDDEGKLDKTKLEDFLKSKGIQPPQGKPPAGAGGPGASGEGEQGAAGGVSGSNSSSSSSSAGSSTEVKSETRQTNPDGSVTTTTKYADGSIKKTTSQPDPEKVSEGYKLQHPEKIKENNTEETEKGSLVSVKI